MSVSKRKFRESDSLSVKDRKVMLSLINQIMNKKISGSVFVHVTKGKNNRLISCSNDYGVEKVDNFVEHLIQIIHPEVTEIIKNVDKIAKGLKDAMKKSTSKKAVSASKKK